MHLQGLLQKQHPFLGTPKLPVVDPALVHSDLPPDMVDLFRHLQAGVPVSSMCPCIGGHVAQPSSSFNVWRICQCWLWGRLPNLDRLFFALLTDCDEGALLGDNSMEDLEDTSSDDLDADVSMHCTVHRALQRLCMMLLALIMLESLTALLMRTFT